MTSSTTSWENLAVVQTQMDGCRMCLDQGYEVTPRAVYSGKDSAQIMVLGQAPGITECEVGRPFNAGSGSRLFQWLSGAGIDEKWFRETQYMTSVTKCYPGRSAAGSGDRVPSKKEQNICYPYLEAEINFIDPGLIIPVGRLAISQFFTSSSPLTELIGSKERIEGRWIVPLPHPSGASRWRQIEANRKLISDAIQIIGKIVREEGLVY